LTSFFNVISYFRVGPFMKINAQHPTSNEKKKNITNSPPLSGERDRVKGFVLEI
jgi:hypothetical protein